MEWSGSLREKLYTYTAAAAQRGTQSLLLKWSKLPGVKERLVLGKKRQGKEREKRQLGIVRFSVKKIWELQFD